MTAKDPLAQARELFTQGTQFFDQGLLEQAHTAFEQALQLAPARHSIVLNLGITKAQLGQSQEAERLLRQAVQTEPEAGDAWASLALCLADQGKWPEAHEAAGKAIGLGFNTASLHLLYGKCCARLGDVKQAVQAYRDCVTLDPNNAEGWYCLGDAFRMLGDAPEAIQAYEHAQAYGAHPELVAYMLSSLQVKQPMLNPPALYVKALFDDYAQDFEKHLVGQLGYCGHTELMRALPSDTPSRVTASLDLGCGTGLCGPALKARSAQVIGVDLSLEMLEKAKLTKAYDELICADALEFLVARRQSAHVPFELVIAADVFIYVGSLEKLFAQLTKQMSPGALLAFTTEPASVGAGVQLLLSLRYAHAPDYIQGLANANEFQVIKQHEAPIRVEKARPMMGEYWYLRRFG